ncbi:MAG: hypothetical protein AAB967_00415, partial [Patescibacteria group bacterium]
VEPALVTEIRAVLIPQNPAVLKETAIKNFWNLGGETVTEENGALLWSGGRLAGKNILDWSENSRTLLTSDLKTGTYFLEPLAPGAPSDVTAPVKRLFEAFPKEKFTFSMDADSPSLLVASSPRALFLLDVERGIRTPIQTLQSGTLGPVVLSRSILAWTRFDETENVSFLVLYNRLLGRENPNYPAVPGKTKRLFWARGGTLTILQDDGEFYLYDVERDNVAKIASDVRDFFFTGDGSRVATLEHESLEVFSFDGDKKYWRFNVSGVENIEKLSWYRDREHLFVGYPDKVLFLDLADASQENIGVVAEAGRWEYDEASNRFYFLKDGKLQGLNFPS